MGRKTNFSIKLSLDAADYLKKISSVSAVTSTAVRGMSRGFKLLSGAFLSVAAVRGMARMTTETMDAVLAVDKLAQSTGMATDDLQAYAKASEFAGTSEMNLTKVLQELSRKRMDAINGNKDLRRSFQDLGFSVDQLATEDTASLFEQLVVSLGDMESATKRDAIAFKIFGKEAQNMTALLLGGREAFAKAREEIERTGASMSRLDLASVRVAAGALADLGDAWDVFKTKLTVALAPLIYEVAHALEAMLLDPARIQAVAEGIGDFVGSIIKLTQTLPAEIGLAWRTVAVDLLEIKRLFSGGFTGMNNAATEEIDARIATIREEMEKLREEVNFTLESDPASWAAKLAEALADIGSISGGGPAPLSAAMERLKTDLESVQTTIEDGLTDTLADFFVTGKNGFKELGQAILTDLVGALLRAQIVTPILGALGLGAGGGALGAIFGGFRAAGGSVDAGKAYVVGENRPELFVPKTAGTIVPDASGALSSRGGGDTYVIDARGADASAFARLEGMIRALHGSVERRSLAAVQNATRRRMPGFA
jgi:hypothetical protein